jgi:hypothetical protein
VRLRHPFFREYGRHGSDSRSVSRSGRSPIPSIDDDAVSPMFDGEWMPETDLQMAYVRIAQWARWDWDRQSAYMKPYMKAYYRRVIKPRRS